LPGELKILVYGYGNPGREDDGLGQALVEKLEEWVKLEGIQGIEFDSNYQLNIEDAEIISNQDIVIFADASTEEITDYQLTEVDGENDVSFTTHAASPGYILKLSQDLFGKVPEVKLLHIKGYRWEFKEGLSKKAKINLEKAFVFIKEYILNLQNQTQNSNLKT
jgi:hydrogenase maturation protease